MVNKKWAMISVAETTPSMLQLIRIIFIKFIILVSNNLIKEFVVLILSLHMAKRWTWRVHTIACQWWISTYYPMYNYWWISKIILNVNAGKAMLMVILFWLILQGWNLRICVNSLINLLFNSFVLWIFYDVLIAMLGDENAFDNF